MLQHAPLLRLAHARRAAVRAEFAQLLLLLQPAHKTAVDTSVQHPSHASHAGRAGDVGDGRGMVVEDVLNWEAYRWAAATISTRSCHYVPVHPLACELQGEKVGTLVPVFDMLNHEPESSQAAVCKLSDSGVHERCYSVVAARRYGEGDEVKIEYGAWGNAGLLEHYGFVIMDNPMDVCPIYLPAPLPLGARAAGYQGGGEGGGGGEGEGGGKGEAGAVRMRCESASSRANTRANKKSKRRHLKSSSSVVLDGEGGCGGWGAGGEGSAEEGGCAAMGHNVVEVYNVVRHVLYVPMPCGVLFVVCRVVRCLL